MKRKEDLRVRKTKLNLYNGLLKLMETTPFDNIRVTDICNVSLVNRSTFYDHFNDKYELFQSYINYIGESTDERLKANVDADNVNDLFIEYIKLLLDEFEDNYKFYEIVFKKNNNSFIRQSLIDILTNNIMKKIEHDYGLKDSYSTKLGVIFYVSGTISLFEYGFTSDDLKFDKEKIINLFEKIIPSFNKEKI